MSKAVPGVMRTCSAARNCTGWDMQNFRHFGHRVDARHKSEVNDHELLFQKCRFLTSGCLETKVPPMNQSL